MHLRNLLCGIVGGICFFILYLYQTQMLKDGVLDSAIISEKIRVFNDLQIVYNEDEFSSSIDLVILVQVHNRIRYLEALIESLSRSANIDKTIIIFSHDVYDVHINEVVRKITFARVMQIFYPFSMQLHPANFPGQDPRDCTKNKIKPHCPNADFKDINGKYRDAHLIQIKHHWWWKINFIFNKIGKFHNYSGYVLLLEEDHYVRPDFLHCFHLMKELAIVECPECALFALGTYRSLKFPKNSNKVIIQTHMENLGLTLNRSIWMKIREYTEDFCKYDDYNWDMSLAFILNLMQPKAISMVMAGSRVVHIGECGTHFKRIVEKCDPSNFLASLKEEQKKYLFPEKLEILAKVIKNLGVGFVKSGGWGDPRDHILCLGM